MVDNKSKSEYEILKEKFKFVWDKQHDQDLNSNAENWEEKFAKNYYDKLFKEFCIGDLSQYKKGRKVYNEF
jgi:protein FRA10AC1